jgi:hypothetical protein
MALEYNKDKYNENLQSGRQRDPNSKGFFGGISTGPEQIPRHIHDGVDSPKILYSNIVQSDVNSFTIRATEGSSADNTSSISNLFSLAGAGRHAGGILKNPKQVFFYGIATRTVGGVLTGKSSVQGNAIFGTSYLFQVGGNSSGNLTEPVNGITQGNTSQTFLRTTITGVGVNANQYSWIPWVSEDNINLASIYDDSGTQTVNMQIIKYTNSDITLQAYVAPDWVLTGSFTII